MGEGPSLYDALGLAPDASAGLLRFEYERAVARATNAGDWQTAARLSAAFDALPGATRSAMYDGRGALAQNAPRFDQQGQPRAQSMYAPSWSNSRPATVASRDMRTDWQQTRKPFKVLGWIIVILIAVGVVAAAVESLSGHGRNHDVVIPPPATQLPVQQPPAQVTTSVPAAPRSYKPIPASRIGDSAIMPSSVPLDGAGYGQVYCVATAYGPAAVYRAKPGDLISCPNLAKPLVRTS